jgi:hypothetical protein
MKRTAICVEPISTSLERRREGPFYLVIVAGVTVYVAGLPPLIPRPARKPEQEIRSCRTYTSC